MNSQEIDFSIVNPDIYVYKLIIENFKCFEGRFTVNLDKGLNIFVGNNETGKSTILEAIHIALSGILNARYLKNELSQYLFNREIEKQYIESLKKGSPLPPPHILIEAFLTGADTPFLAKLNGNINSTRTDEHGVLFRVEFDEQYQSEYQEMIRSNANNIQTIPIEYYKVNWRSFAQETITSRSIPVKSVLINSSVTRYQNGSDVYISRIIRENLEDREKVEISQAHRQMKEAFMDAPSVQAINIKINEKAALTNKEVKISVDLSTQNAWESSLMTYLDDIPFHQIGKGEQCIVKTNLALSHKKSQEANIILLEEPENHLSHVKLNELINKIKRSIVNKQIIISTHSSFVANKLGLDHLILLSDFKNIRLNELSTSTKDFFAKLSGYDTLRLILCDQVMLVEGDSDELIVQKAYITENGCLPIENGIEVISVGTSFLRFLEIAKNLNKKVVVMTDTDGNIEALQKKYSPYASAENVKICFDMEVDTGNLDKFNYNTLEPKILKANSREKLNQIFETEFENEDDLNIYMKNNKTDCALCLFNTDESFDFPSYILKALEALK